MTTNRFYFLSRPRRFGKSLLVSTLKALFQGQRTLFDTLAISKTNYAFPTYPVIHIDGSGTRVQNKTAFEQSLIHKLNMLIEDHGWQVTLTGSSPRDCLGQLIQFLRKEAGQVVVLIDEYDKPILDHWDDLETAKMIRDVLKDFYSAVKEQDDRLRFVLVTGVSKFSKVSLFSGLNNLTDITQTKDYASLLGITQEELERDLREHSRVMAAECDVSHEALLDHLRTWYNGYRFTDKPLTVYNPVSLLRALNERRFGNFWFETATPTMLIQQIRSKPHFQLQEVGTEFIGTIAFDTFDIEALDLTALLLQTGYLTIAESAGKIERTYRLDYPNYEVKKAFYSYLIEDFSVLQRGFSATPLVRCARALVTLDAGAFQKILQQDFFAKIPYNLHMPYERYYQSLFHMLFVLLGLEIQAEVATSQGRIDHVLTTQDQIFIVEMKYDRPAAEAIQQIHEKQYASGYLGAKQQIILVGLGMFNSRNIEAAFEILSKD